MFAEFIVLENLEAFGEKESNGRVLGVGECGNDGILLKCRYSLEFGRVWKCWNILECGRM